ncbi:MAG: outer membrane lipoprotein carrier protein LolA [Gammaproteobacteria bacterium]|nr:outer membrane lipoprotein carrier protein LolA [Gammaproteobacteria bacterium]MBU1553578.1 outer membrane lipoprotein carrier protein LolA [Gammaproteobacteria bacterium]MBU2070598.1 outer membrane lipoprotein carrier protein LolA [Gammaproteobacteria bacterium]MBU2181980.1 outer membrane lipoprotein carrier protein LolA [Gammaproteobacteria bacterium]MBU2207104.1 outer membrane lipoprotein carrier protein LolA [Gammaproteobacteria bacterium]
MMRLGVSLLLSLLLIPAQAADSPQLRFKPLQGQLAFKQTKQLQGLPVALKSSGYIQLAAEQLLWHTTTPVDSKLQVSPAGVSQWQQQQYVAVSGSEFVGQLMLAILQQQHQFIRSHFALSDDDGCQLLQPLQAPLNTLFVQIRLCGDSTLQQIVLHETNGNSTTIDLLHEASLD